MKLIYEKYKWRDLEAKLISLSDSGFYSLSLNRFIIYSKSKELIVYIDHNLKLNDVLKIEAQSFSGERVNLNLSNTVFRQKLMSKLGTIEYNELLTVINKFNEQFGRKVNFIKKRGSVFTLMLNLMKKIKSQISLIGYIFIRFIIGVIGFLNSLPAPTALIVTPDWLIKSESDNFYTDPSVRNILNDLKRKSQTFNYITIPHRGSNRSHRIFNLFKAKHLTIEIIIFLYFFKGLEKKWSFEEIIKVYLKASEIKVLYISSEYSRLSEIFVSAANDLNILTIGVQHGAITKGHPGYAQGNWSSQLRPRMMMVTDDVARNELIELGLEESRIMIEKKANNSITFGKRSKMLDDKKKILIISNPFIQSRLQTTLIAKPDYVLDDNFIVDVKLHPNEESKGYFYNSNCIKKTIKNLNILPKGLDIQNIIQDYDIVVSFASKALETSFDLGIPTIEIKDNILFFERFYDLKGDKGMSNISQTSFRDLIGFLNSFDIKAWCINYDLVKKDP